MLPSQDSMVAASSPPNAAAGSTMRSWVTGLPENDQHAPHLHHRLARRQAEGICGTPPRPCRHGSR
jgi:hypothetical protein